MKIKNLTMLSVFATIFASCGGNQQAQQQGGIQEYAVATLAATNSELTHTYPAAIRGKQDIEIRPQVSGFITKVCIEEGSVVHKGQPLFVIDQVQYEEAVNQAKASVNVANSSVATAELTYKNKKELFTQNVIGKFDLQTAENTWLSAKAQLAQAKAALVSAKKNLSFCTVTSPSNGVVGSIPYRVGSLVSASTTEPLTVVSNIDQMYVYFSMTEKQLLEMTRQSGTTQRAMKEYPAVKLKLADGTIYDNAGKIETISGVIDETTGSVSMRATFKNPQHLLKSGGSGVVLLPYESKGTVLIPQKATSEVQDQKYAFVVGKDNKVVNTQIKVAELDNGKDYIVLEGLSAGDRVVVEGIASLKDGMEIKPITEQEAAKKIAAAAQMSKGQAPQK
ncbi:MAG: efflux RND transporter periplasmic adaptor subunit [Bacteroidaceae bacterium]